MAEHQLLPYQHILQTFYQAQNVESQISGVPSSAKSKTEILKPSITKTDILKPSITKTDILKQSTSFLNTKDSLSSTKPTTSTSEVSPTVHKDFMPIPTVQEDSITGVESTRNNDLSGNGVRKQRVESLGGNSTLAAVSAPSKVQGSREEEAEDKGLSAKRKTKTKHKSAGNETAIVPVYDHKNHNKWRTKGLTVKCDGLDICDIQNPNLTEDEVRAKAREIVGSFRRKRRKYENGHSYTDPHTCEFCLKVLSNGKRLRKHLFTVHLSNFGQYPCEFCPQRFVYATLLKEHRQMHLDVPRFTCTICNAGFKHRSGNRFKES